MQTGGVMKQMIGLILMSIITTPTWATEVVTTTNAAQPGSVMMFVSFSMPRQSLIAALRDANKIKASVVMRGLVNNSFKETFQAIGNLVKEAGGGGIELNPLAFKRFQIETVPAVVVISPNHPCLTQPSCSRQQDFDVMSGNIPLAAALRELSNRGVAAPHEAERALHRLQAGDYV